MRVMRGVLIQLLVAGCLAGGSAFTLAAQAIRSAQVGVSLSPVQTTAHREHRGTARPSSALTDSVARSKTPFVVGGAVVGALVGGLLAASFEEGFCGSPATGYACTATSPAEGAFIGMAVGVLAGLAVWVVSRSRSSGV